MARRIDILLHIGLDVFLEGHVLCIFPLVGQFDGHLGELEVVAVLSHYHTRGAYTSPQVYRQ